MYGKNNFVKTICLIIAAVLIAGCSGRHGQNTDNTNNPGTGGVINDAGDEDGYVYAPTFSEYKILLTEDGSTAEASTNIEAGFLNDDVYYVIERSYVGKGGFKTFVSMTKLESGEHCIKDINNAEKYIVMNEGFAGYDVGNDTIFMYDKNAELINTVDIKNIVEAVETDTGAAFYCSDIVVDDKGRIGIAGECAVLILDSDGGLLQSIALPENVYSARQLILTKEGNWYAVCDVPHNGSFICKLDVEHGSFGEWLEAGEMGYAVGRYRMYTSEEGGFYFVAGSYIYWYDEGKNCFERVLCFRDYGIEFDQYNTSTDIGEGDAIYIGNISVDKEDESAEYELARLEKKHPSEILDRQEIVLGCFHEPSAYDDERKAILKFNKYNPDYYVTVKSYNTGGDGYDTSMQTLYNDLITGNGPDIFLVDSNNYDFDIAGLGRKGILVNLYDLMDKDSRLHKEDFIPSVLKGMEQEDGKLYWITPVFTMYYNAGKTALLGEYEPWNYEALLKLMEAYPAAQLYDIELRGNVLGSIMYSMGSFYDEGTGECSFDTEEFKALLKVAAAMPEDWDNSLWEDMPAHIKKDDVLIYSGSIMEPYDIEWVEALFGSEDVTYIGYPASEGKAVLGYFGKGFSINAQSENVDGAWEFLKQYFAEDYQSDRHMPVIKEYFDKSVEEAKCYDPGKNKSNLFQNGMNIWKTPITDEQAKTIYELLDNAVGKGSFNYDIYKIIVEEAQGYFAGDKGLDDTVSVIQDRVQLYIDENR